MFSRYFSSSGRIIKIPFFRGRISRAKKIGKRSLARVEKYSFLPRDIRGEKAESGSFKSDAHRVSLHPGGVKNDIKFKSSLNKKSFPEARDRIIHSSENSKVKYPRRRPAGFSIINFNVMPDKNAKHPDGDEKREKEEEREGVRSCRMICFAR